MDKSEVLSKLSYLQSKFMMVMDQLTEDQLDAKVQENEDGWTTIEIMRHIATAEGEIIELIKQVTRGEGGVDESFDISEENEKNRKKDRDLGRDEINERMQKSRKKTLEFLNNVDQINWDNRARYFNGEIMTISRMFEILMWHQNHHLKQIIETLSLEI